MVKDYETGRIVPYSVKGLARGIIDLMKDSDLRNKCGQSAREDVKKRFNINNTLEKIEGYIE